MGGSTEEKEGVNVHNGMTACRTLKERKRSRSAWRGDEQTSGVSETEANMSPC